MTNKHTQQLEQIIVEMKANNTDCQLWIEFLKQVDPQSPLLNTSTDFDKPMRLIANVHDIMILAEEKQYPTWYIQPWLRQQMYMLEYNKGTLKSIIATEDGQTKTIQTHNLPGPLPQPNGFTGKIRGTWQETQATDPPFIAYDADIPMTFLQKMEYLESVGLKIAEYVLFPTDKIPTISSIKLETFFHQYISKAKELGLPVDGVVIVSDTSLFPPDENNSSKHFIFTVAN